MRVRVRFVIPLIVGAITASAHAQAAPSSSSRTGTSSLSQPSAATSLDTDPRQLRVSELTRVSFDVGTSRIRLYLSWDF